MLLIVSLQKGQKHGLKKATITLSDCLACSGCVTSAETVLLEQQSQAELLGILEQNEIFRKVNMLILMKKLVNFYLSL